MQYSAYSILPCLSLCPMTDWNRGDWKELESLPWNWRRKKLQIRQKTCYIEQNGSGGPIILWGMYPHRGNEIAHMWDCLMETVNNQDFLFCAFQVKDWKFPCRIVCSMDSIWNGYLLSNCKLLRFFMVRTMGWICVASSNKAWKQYLLKPWRKRRKNKESSHGKSWRSN